MIDIKIIRENPKLVEKAAKDRGVKIDMKKVVQLDEEWRRLTALVENVRHEKKNAGKEGLRPRGPYGPEDGKALKTKEQDLESELRIIEEKLNTELRKIPNIPLKGVPVGSVAKNKVIREVGKKPKFDFQPKEYLEITKNLDLIDTERAAKVSGSRFGYLKGEAVRWEFGLIVFAHETLAKQGFTPVVPPVLVRPQAMQGMGYLDYGAEEVYRLEKDDLYLVGTSEQSVVPMHMDEIFEARELPKRYVAFSTCFRREAGAYGRDVKGILRVHQFDKIEMISFTTPEDSAKELEFLVAKQEELVQALKISYRIVQLATGDLSHPSAATYDLEMWLPGQGEYRETHSASNTTDFQARRLNIRFRRSGGEKPEFVHILNATAFAIGRTLIGLIENYQTKTGTVEVPGVLQKYLTPVVSNVEP